MKTPAGKECPYYYADYFRGREHEECRLLESSSKPHKWAPKLCFTCPVAGVLQANACPHMVLEGQVERPFPFLNQRVGISAYCTKTKREVDEPHIGCGECHPLPPIFDGG